MNMECWKSLAEPIMPQWAFSVIVKSLQTFVSSSTQQVTNPDTEQQTDMKQRHFHVARWHLIIKAISWVEQLHHLTEHDDVCAVVKVLYHMLHTHTVCLYSCAQPFISIFPSKCFDVLTFFEGCTWSWTRKWTWAAPWVWSWGRWLGTGAHWSPSTPSSPCTAPT